MIRFASILLMILLANPRVFAQEGPGGLAGSPFRMGFDARSIGMGNAVIARPMSDNPSTYNPAMLPYVTTQNVHLGAALLPLDRSLFHISYSAPLPPSAGVSFSAMGARVGDIQGRDNNGIPTEVYSTNEYVVAFGFGLRPTPGLTIGASAKLLHARLLPELTSTTVGLDFGASYLVTNGITVGAAARDVNSKYRWDSTPLYGRNGNNTVDTFPRRLILGVSWLPANLPLLVDVEGESISGTFIFRVGAEYRLHPSLHVRAGVDGIDPERRLGARVTFGASVDGLDVVWNPVLDYAFMIEPFVHTGGHFLTVRLHLGE